MICNYTKKLYEKSNNLREIQYKESSLNEFKTISKLLNNLFTVSFLNAQWVIAYPTTHFVGIDFSAVVVTAKAIKIIANILERSFVIPFNSQMGRDT